MSNQEWLRENWEHLQHSAKNITNNSPLARDLLHESVLILWEKPDLQSIINSGGATYYLVRVMMNQYRSKTSPFFKKYMNFDRLPESYDAVEEDHQEANSLLTEELESLHWYDSAVFKMYMNGDSISKISRETGIPRSSLTLTVNRVKDHLRKKYREIHKES